MSDYEQEYWWTLSNLKNRTKSLTGNYESIFHFCLTLTSYRLSPTSYGLPYRNSDRTLSLVEKVEITP